MSFPKNTPEESGGPSSSAFYLHFKDPARQSPPSSLRHKNRLPRQATCMSSWSSGRRRRRSGAPGWRIKRFNNCLSGWPEWPWSRIATSGRPPAAGITPGSALAVTWTSMCVDARPKSRSDWETSTATTRRCRSAGTRSSGSGSSGSWTTCTSLKMPAPFRSLRYSKVNFGNQNRSFLKILWPFKRADQIMQSKK